MISQLAIFEQSCCDCQQCLRTCTGGKPGALAPGDIANIADHIGAELSEAFAEKMFTACIDGPRTACESDPDAESPCFRPKTKPDGRCIFLTGDNRCSIYPARPFECSRYNPCDPASGAAAMKALGMVISKSPAYVQQWWQLKKKEYNTP